MHKRLSKRIVVSIIKVHNICGERIEEARAHTFKQRFIQYMCDIGLEKESERWGLALQDTLAQKKCRTLQGCWVEELKWLIFQTRGRP